MERMGDGNSHSMNVTAYIEIRNTKFIITPDARKWGPAVA